MRFHQGGYRLVELLVLAGLRVRRVVVDVDAACFLFTGPTLESCLEARELEHTRLLAPVDERVPVNGDEARRSTTGHIESEGLPLELGGDGEKDKGVIDDDAGRRGRGRRRVAFFIIGVRHPDRERLLFVPLLVV